MINFFKRYSFIFFLLIVVLLSYGQLVKMYVWQDDNALFFKLAHIEERAGYLGEGPFGTGPYKYTATTYIPIYHLFGFETKAYFTFTLILYFISTIVVYKVLANILGKQAGKIAGFLYAAGYIASDGFIRLFNSVITSVSVILISLLFLSYWNFYRLRTLKWYLLALIFFFLATEFARGRTHYLISVIILFELLFLAFEKPIKNFFYSGVRLIPFVYIFYQYFVINADYRSGQVKNLLVALLNGEFHQTYSLITSLTNIVLPDWLTNIFINIDIRLITWISLLTAILMVVLLFKKHKFKKVLIPTFSLSLIIWKFSVNDLYSSIVLNLGQDRLFIVLLGGEILLLLVATLFVIEGYKRVYALFISWVILNIAVYAAYNPTVSYESINRYLAHSFLVWVFLLGVFYISIKNKFWEKIALILILFWGFGNLSNSLIYQHRILEIRINPVRAFYNQLKDFVPIVQKGDVFYFDVAEDTKSNFREAFSVAQMPETTALAWRYGIDRYDIQLFTNFSEFAQAVATQNIPAEKIHTFWYSDSGLLDTSNTVREFLFQGDVTTTVSFVQEGNVITLTESLISTVPIRLTIRLQASAVDPSTIEFPYEDPGAASTTPIHTNRVLQQRVFVYAKVKDAVMKTAEYQTSSQWRERKKANLNDGDLDSVWQADRVLWQKRNESITIDLKKPQEINRFVWINGFANNTPTKYNVEISLDGTNWVVVASENRVQRVDTKDPQVITFPPRLARYYKLVFTETLGGDSPGIAEAWVVPDRVGEINITDAETFLQRPFNFVSTKDDFSSLLVQMAQTGQIQLWWQSDKRSDWQTQSTQKIIVRFDGNEREVKVVLPAGGTQIKKLKLSDLTIPGAVVVEKITAKSLSIDEIP